MDGRLQNELRIDRKNREKLKEMPDYVNRWYMNMKASDKTASTCCDYLRKVNKFLKYINDDVINIKASDINEDNVTGYYLSIQTKEVNGEEIYTSDSYQGTVYSCLDNFLGYLYKTGLIEYNYINLINKPKNRDLDRINEHRILLTEKDFKMIINAVNTENNKTMRCRDRAIILLLMHTGMRKTALSNIVTGDIDFKNHKLTVIDKGNKRHEYILDDAVYQAIIEWISVRHNFLKNRNEEYLFISTHGRGMSGNTLSDVVGKYTEIALGKRISPHKLRSGYCSILYNKTGDIEFVRRAVGHANSNTTQRYIVTKGEERRKAAEIMSSIF